MRSPQRGVILPTVLFILVLLGLLVAIFAFRVNADLAATQAVTYRFQTRLAAEAGVERVKLMLRSGRDDVDLWYHNPEELHRIIVWGHDTDPAVWGTNEEFGDAEMTYRFSIVADDPSDAEKFVRFGITDESAKLNLNVATEDQLFILVGEAVRDDEELNAGEIVDAILDWRDADAEPRGEGGDTETEYYRSLDKPYLVKNGPFDTVEELLLVKGVTPYVLYGEDYDRNGLLSANEDDGDKSFPPDNEDGLLNRGLYPYLTVYSYEQNISNDNRPRIYLFGDEPTLRAQLAEEFEGEPEIVEYMVQATRGAQGAGAGGPNDNTGNAGAPEGSNNDNAGAAGGSGNEKRRTRQQVKPEDEDETGDTDPSTEIDEEDQESGEEPVEAEESDADDGAEEEANEPGADETDDETEGSRPIVSPASLMRDRSVDGELVPSPLGWQHLAKLLDRTTTVAADKGPIRGLINVSTAPREVLRCLEALSEEQIDRIVTTRVLLGSAEKATAAWLVTEEIVDMDTFELIAPNITARGRQFTIEALGYADHFGMVSRIQVIVDMLGPIAQPVYYRDLTGLGGHYPIRETDLETFRVR